MSKRTIHNSTVTLKLPPDSDHDAVRAAGIPVDALGQAERCSLFVRHGDRRRSSANIFRRFVCEVWRAVPSLLKTF